MKIDYAKILAEKKRIKASSTGVDQLMNITEGLCNLINESVDTVVQNISGISDNPLVVPFLNHYVVTENVDADNIHKISDILPIDSEALPRLSTAYEYYNSTEWLKIDTKYQFARRRFNDACVCESAYVEQLQLIGYNINTSPETISRYAKILQSIEIDDYDDVVKCFPDLLKTNTEIVLGLRIVLTGQPANMLVSLPNIIVNRLINEGTKSQQKAFIPIIQKSLSDVTAFLKTGDARHYNMYIAYLDNLTDAKYALQQAIVNSVTEALSLEHIAELQPDIVLYEDGVIEDPIAELEDAMADIVFDDCDTIAEESLVRLTKIANQINHLYTVTEVSRGAEKVNKMVRKVAYKTEEKSRKTASNIDAARKDSTRNKYALKKGIEPFTNAISRWVDDIKEMDKKERRERIITGSFKTKLFKTLRKLILGAAGLGAGIAIAKGVGVFGAIGTLALTVIAIITGCAIDKRIDTKVRKELLHELETELAVTNEKLEDVRGDNSKEKKYQLIRIKKKLEADIDKIKFDLK